MGRYRPPRTPGSFYITPEGEKTLRAEVYQLWKIERPEVTARVHEAAKNGDRSENGDYIYGKKRMREIDSRVGFLTRRLDKLEVVDRIPKDQEKIYFGAWVSVIDEDEHIQNYRIVGPDEFDLKLGKISMDSPLAKALLGKRLGDDIIVKTPEGERELYIEKVWYETITR